MFWIHAAINTGLIYLIGALVTFIRLTIEDRIDGIPNDRAARAVNIGCSVIWPYLWASRCIDNAARWMRRRRRARATRRAIRRFGQG